VTYRHLRVVQGQFILGTVTAAAAMHDLLAGTGGALLGGIHLLYGQQNRATARTNVVR